MLDNLELRADFDNLVNEWYTKSDAGTPQESTACVAYFLLREKMFLDCERALKVLIERAKESVLDDAMAQAYTVFALKVLCLNFMGDYEKVSAWVYAHTEQKIDVERCLYTWDQTHDA